MSLKNKIKQSTNLIPLLYLIKETILNAKQEAPKTIEETKEINTKDIKEKKIEKKKSLEKKIN